MGQQQNFDQPFKQEEMKQRSNSYSAFSSSFIFVGPDKKILKEENELVEGKQNEN